MFFVWFWLVISNNTCDALVRLWKDSTAKRVDSVQRHKTLLAGSLTHSISYHTYQWHLSLVCHS